MGYFNFQAGAGGGGSGVDYPLRTMVRDEQERQRDAEASQRKAMVGSGDRSEKIRTYNFPQNRLTDHRIGLTTHQLNMVMEGMLQPTIDALIAHNIAEKMKGEGDAA